MDSNIQLGFQLLLVGMLSVFFILGIVIGIGKALILIVNKYASEQKSSTIKRVPSNNNKHLAVITAVVEVITLGKGSVQSIKKI